MQHKRTYYNNTKSPEAWPIFRVVVLPTELVMGLLIALQGAKPVTE